MSSLRALPGVARAANVTYLTMQVRRGKVDARAMVVGFEASQAQLRASRMLNEGRAEEAERTLAAAEQQLRQSQVQFSDETVQGNLMRQADSVSRGRRSAGSAATA